MGWRQETAILLMAAGFSIGMGSCSPSSESPISESQGFESAVETTAPDPASPEVSPEPETKADLAPTQAQKPPAQDYFRDAVNRAGSAVSIGQTAHSEADWQLAVSRWQQAIKLMQQVPDSSPDYPTAQTKIQEYQKNLAIAQKQASGELLQTVAKTSPTPTGLVAQIPILQRRGGTPVVPVALQGQNGRQEFTMLFDTGATGTLITPAMADALGVVVVDQATVTIADGSQVTMPIGYVDYIEVGGFKREGVLVAIGGDVGLLGQDVYGEFGISLGSQTINLYK